uniref:Uncharacterized protein n=1 Tax=Rhizophora mucronata TaxID=61149 RepID=A0A2P2MZB8_RHIMU
MCFHFSQCLEPTEIADLN